MQRRRALAAMRRAFSCGRKMRICPSLHAKTFSPSKTACP